MDADELEKKLHPYIKRTKAKLRFAQIHLDELRTYENLGLGDDFEISHEESFFFHLIGAADAFLQELNICYDINLPSRDIKRYKLDKEWKHIPEYTELRKLEKDQNSWLNIATKTRYYLIHRQRIAYAFYVGAEKKVLLVLPISNQWIEPGVISSFESWHSEMGMLLERLRQSAQKNRGKG